MKHFSYIGVSSFCKTFHIYPNFECFGNLELTFRLLVNRLSFLINQNLGNVYLGLKLNNLLIPILEGQCKNTAINNSFSRKTKNKMETHLPFS